MKLNIFAILSAHQHYSLYSSIDSNSANSAKLTLKFSTVLHFFLFSKLGWAYYKQAIHFPFEK